MATNFAIWLVAVLTLAAGPAAALVPGGGSAKTDCFAEWQVTTPERGPDRGKFTVDCQDGDPRCDVDGPGNGTCTIGVSVCLFEPDGCTPQPVTAVKLSHKAQALGLQAPATTPPVSTPTCGPATLVTLPLRGKKPSRPLKLGLTAIGTGKPRRDVDTLVLRCVPNTGSGQCPANPNGGPRELHMLVPDHGSDLDDGWSGLGHNFPVVFGTELRMCLAGCDPSTNPACTEDATSTDQVNGATFGPPLPLFTVAPTCVVIRFASPKLTDGTADLATGAVNATVHLLSDVYVTTPTELCPRCSGSDIGKSGVCQGGSRDGQACRTEGVDTLTTAPGNQRFTLSSDCPPAGTPAGTIAITLPLTTATSTLSGSKPCPGQAQDDACRGGTCDATCTGGACQTMSDGQCIDAKGGVSQDCCSTDSTRPCFPTAGGGSIVRVGTPAIPVPRWPDPTYPKTGTGTLVGTVCEGSSGAITVDATTGLPGPGSLILPVEEEWRK